MSLDAIWLPNSYPIEVITQKLTKHDKRFNRARVIDCLSLNRKREMPVYREIVGDEFTRSYLMHYQVKDKFESGHCFVIYNFHKHKSLFRDVRGLIGMHNNLIYHESKDRKNVGHLAIIAPLEFIRSQDLWFTRRLQQIEPIND